MNTEEDNLDTVPIEVTVKMLKVNQFIDEQPLNFNDELLRTLEKIVDDSTITTTFVDAIFKANWSWYQREIIRTLIVPFVAYLISILCFLMYALRDDIFKK